MKVNRKDISMFIKRIKFNNPTITDDELAESLAQSIEVNPSCIDVIGRSTTGRYRYQTVGYGVFSLLGEFYRMGRIEVFDKEEDTGYSSSEGNYCMPFIAANQFECFINTLKTDFPIQIEIGNMELCRQSVSKELRIPVEKLNDKETKQGFYASRVSTNNKFVVE